MARKDPAGDMSDHRKETKRIEHQARVHQNRTHEPGRIERELHGNQGDDPKEGK